MRKYYLKEKFRIVRRPITMWSNKKYSQKQRQDYSPDLTSVKTIDLTLVKTIDQTIV